ncbi:hypothetical protein HBI56_017410 [Parastagonospora nodorum]|uniref:Uncharacterized protein n=1 Tax=Phaeosphaeria nodorum (strain SN15 / ATCC MYA-4574 / FGSC 10173) TaxID=321614 RepID=A0A7U2F0W9_PHANO|nr:hypothetical protein HBH56_082600 [Parastagonospora nodorum]QRC96671.1 hypothetical protein JI435_409400 [Parastagonospora nodorum SN15]KAH3929851.1 hypothetical protein HBH54_119240 [Parastagonospora nodorum]KAH3955633.1 hypothetical protein HBH53_005330 [Parastagonospora nodorum]KAH3976766.1 hypothetical protein HBH51_076190 [Parastagonospora nodorum]
MNYGSSWTSCVFVDLLLPLSHGTGILVYTMRRCLHLLSGSMEGFGSISALLPRSVVDAARSYFVQICLL